MGIKERAAERSRRLLGHRAQGFAQAEDWDLRYWQSQTPEERLSALVAIRRDVALVEQGKEELASRKQR